MNVGYPRLYKSNETDFDNNGLGLLKDATDVSATEENNSLFELQLEYDSNGFLADKLDEEMIIKAKANDKQDDQLFRIYSITKSHNNDNLVINAQHITYDLANKFVEKLEATSMTKKEVMEKIGNSTTESHDFTITSPNNKTESSTKLYRTNPLQMIAGVEGSILQIWGGQLERDNYRLVLHDRRGSDDGVLVTYAKNLTGLEAKTDMSNVVTRIYPFKVIQDTENDEEQLITVGDANGGNDYIDSPLIDKYNQVCTKPVEFNDEDIETSEDLYKASKNYFKTGNKGYNKDKPKMTIDVQFEPLWHTEEYKDWAPLEYVGIGDTVTVRHSKLGVYAQARVNKVEYNTLANKNKSVGLGDAKANLTTKVNDTDIIRQKADDADKKATQATHSANGKNTNYYGPNEPTGDNLKNGDLWFKVVDGEYTRTYRFDGTEWQIINDMADKEAHDLAAEARDRAEDAHDKANNAVDDAQDAFDKAQKGIDTAEDAFNRADEGFNKASDAFDKAEDNADEVKEHAERISDNEGNITTVTSLAEGLQTKVSDNEGNINTITSLAKGNKSRLEDAEGNISELINTSDSLVSRIGDVESWEIGGNNLIKDSENVPKNFGDGYRGVKTKYENADMSDEWGFKNAYKITMTNFSEDVPVFGLAVLSRHSGMILNQEYTYSVYLKNVGNKTVTLRTNGLGSANYVDVEPGKSTRYVSTGERRKDYDWFQFHIKSYRKSDELPDKLEVVVGREQLQKGNKLTDWTPAPEDIKHDVSELTQTVKGFKTRVKDAEGDISTLQQKSDSFATKIEDNEDGISSLTQTAKGLQTQVSDNKGNITTVTELANGLVSRVDNLQVGGRNLLENSDFSDGFSHWGESSEGKFDETLILQNQSYIPNFSKRLKIEIDSSDNQAMIRQSVKTEKGKEYTVSAWVKASKGKVSFQQGNADIGYEHKTFDANSFERISWTFTAEDDDIGIYIGSRRAENKDGAEIYIVGMQLEQGNVLSDWSPNPDDAYSEISQLRDNINLRVKKGDTITQINLEAEKGEAYIGGKAIILDGDATVNGSFKVKRANIPNLDAGMITFGTLDGVNLSAVNIEGSTFYTGDSKDYTKISDSKLTARGRYKRTWLGKTETVDVRTMLQNGYLRFRNDNDDSSLYFSWYGASTYADGDGNNFGSGGSSGSLYWWDETYSGGREQRGITMNSHAGSPALSSDLNKVIIHPMSDRSNKFFHFTKSEDGHDLYMLLSKMENGEADKRGGLRINNTYDGSVSIVDKDSATGGDTTIEAGIGEFNELKRRPGNKYLDIVTRDHLRVGTAGNGDRRIVAHPVYSRTSSASSNVRVTDHYTLKRTTSASKYKNMIEYQHGGTDEQLQHSLSILDISPRKWYDKAECDMYADEIEKGEQIDPDAYKISQYVGLVAEDVEKAGLKEHLIYNNGELEEIEYDRLWIHLLPITKDHKTRIEALEDENLSLKKRIKKLEESS